MSWPAPGVPIPASRVNTDILATEQNKGVSMARIYIPVGSVTGTALAVAQAVSQQLETEGHQTRVDENAAVEQLQDWDVVLVCTSTTGRGDVPGNLLPFYQQLQQAEALTGKPFGVISLGDSSYDFTFCGAGERIEQQLLALQALQLVPRVTIDATETATPDDDALFWLKEWSARLSS